MNKKGPIIVVEDDKEDQEILMEIFAKLNYRNEILFFENGDDLVDYFTKPSSHPFLVLSDINLPMIDGFELRNKIFKLGNLNAKFVPFLFFTTGTHKKAIADAYALSVQGFFIKSNNLTGLENTIRIIIDYWQECIGPN